MTGEFYPESQQPMSVDLSVIVPAHNEASMIRFQLNALRAQTKREGWELIVVDHRSSDDTGAIARSYIGSIPQMRVLRCGVGSNVAAARNFGAAYAQGVWLAFCDADDVVDRHWVEVMQKALATHPLVAGRLDHDFLNTQSPTYRARQQSQGLVYFFGSPVVIGANFGCWKEVWDHVGGNDESLNTSDDVDFALRVGRELGIYPHFEPLAVINYRHRGGSKAAWLQGFRYGKEYPRFLAQYSDVLPNRPNLFKLLISRGLLAVSAIPRLFTKSGRPLVAFRFARLVGYFIGLFDQLQNESTTQRSRTRGLSD